MWFPARPGAYPHRPDRHCQRGRAALHGNTRQALEGGGHGLRGQRTRRGAREADLGIAGGDGVGLLFRRGEIIKGAAVSSLWTAAEGGDRAF